MTGRPSIIATTLALAIGLAAAPVASVVARSDAGAAPSRSPAAGDNRMHNELKSLMDFSAAGDEPDWIVLNDDVMGGVSRGAVLRRDGVLQFTGTLSLENNGGFASIRTRELALDLDGVEALWLRVKGDGRRWELRLATEARFRGSRVSYSAPFGTTADSWIEVRLPLDDFVPTWRGSRLQGPPLQRSEIREIGLLIGDKQEKPFTLEVDWIRLEPDAN